jgi:hypothetical protein
MAGAAVATRKKAASGSAKGAMAEKKPKISEADELAALAQASKELEDEERAKTGNQNSFITLVKANGQVLDKNNPAYMPGVKTMDYVIASKKLRLGKTLDATILGMFKVYAEVKKKEKDNEMAPTVGFWMPEDAAQFQVTPGGIFDRELPNGNLLQPVHWVFLYLHDHPEVEDGLISFRSKGNSIYAQLEKLIKSESSVCTELRFAISNQDIYNEKYKKTDYYPKFEIVGHNYKLTEDGKVVKAKDSKLDTATLKEILERSKKAYENYKQLKMVAKRNIQALLGSPGRPALPAGKGGYENDDGDSENVNF